MPNWFFAMTCHWLFWEQYWRQIRNICLRCNVVTFYRELFVVHDAKRLVTSSSVSHMLLIVIPTKLSKQSLFSIFHLTDKVKSYLLSFLLSYKVLLYMLQPTFTHIFGSPDCHSRMQCCCFGQVFDVHNNLHIY